MWLMFVHLSLLRYLLGVDVVRQVRGEVAVRIGQGLLDVSEQLVVLLSLPETFLQLLLPQRCLKKQETVLE